MTMRRPPFAPPPSRLHRLIISPPINFSPLLCALLFRALNATHWKLQLRTSVRDRDRPHAAKQILIAENISVSRGRNNLHRRGANRSARLRIRNRDRTPQGCVDFEIAVLLRLRAVDDSSTGRTDISVTTQVSNAAPSGHSDGGAVRNCISRRIFNSAERNGCRLLAGERHGRWTICSG